MNMFNSIFLTATLTMYAYVNLLQKGTKALATDINFGNFFCFFLKIQSRFKHIRPTKTGLGTRKKYTGRTL